MAIFFDMEKAYDTSWKYGIMKDLHSLCFHGHLPKFISSFLSDRTQVRVGSTRSNSYDQETGVPQGSVLSVTLFSIKINSIVDRLSKSVDPSLFVDDFLLCCSGKYMRSIERQLQLSLNYVHKWSVENGFRFSKSKTVAVHFCQLRSLHLDPSLKLGGEVIKVVKEAKVLGILFDIKLTFISHIKALKARCLKALDVLKMVANTNWEPPAKCFCNSIELLSDPSRIMAVLCMNLPDLHI